MAPQTYTNPVFPGYFADPFVWRSGNYWYAVGTGALEAHSAAGSAVEALTVSGKPGVFQLLRSADFLNWQPLGTALELLEPGYGNAYWAPEVAFAEGRFWLYYSVGFGDKGHHLRVAVSEEPEGPFRDTGHLLTNPFDCPFAIDASPFCDEDGQWYLFYARDYLDSSDNRKTGTGIAMDRLAGMSRLAGEEQTVVRARFPWQQFQKNRIIYGNRYDWHTVEGPCVRKRAGRYWCLFSSGRWEDETYGVDWAVADRIGGPWTFNGNGEGPRLLRTLSGSVLGPGHACVATGPHGATDYLVYHAWDAKMTARRMFVDALAWSPEGPACGGPTITPTVLR